MSSGCGDVLSLADLQTAKKHQIFEAEVITGKSGGVAGGADIDYATNQVTGQTQQTLPSILADLGFDVQPWTSSTGGVLASANQVFLNDTSGSLGLGDYYAWGGTFPKAVPAGTDPALPTSGYVMRSSRFAGTQARESLRRSYAEAGYNLVDGSFEAGGTLVNANDVLLQERTGKAFSGPAGTVAAGTNPASGGFVDKSGVVLAPKLIGESVWHYPVHRNGINDDAPGIQAWINNQVTGIYPEVQGRELLLPWGLTPWVIGSPIDLPPGCILNCQNAAIKPLGNPVALFRIDTRYKGSGNPNAQRFWQGTSVKNFRVWSDRGFGVPTQTTDCSHAVLVLGGWLMRADFENISCDPGVAMKSVIAFDLRHTDPSVSEVGVPDSITFRKVSCLYAENTSFAISIIGDDTTVGTGCRMGSVTFEHIYGNPINKYDYNDRNASNGYFGGVYIKNVKISSSRVYQIFADTQSVLLDGALCEISNSKLDYIYSEHNKSYNIRPAVIRGLNGAKIINSDFGLIRLYSEVDKYSESPQMFDVQCFDCNFNKVVVDYRNAGAESGGRWPPADFFKLQFGSSGNKFHNKMLWNYFSVTSDAWSMSRISVPFGNYFPYCNDFGKQTNRMLGNSIPAGTAVRVAKISSKDLDAHSNIRAKCEVQTSTPTASATLRVNFSGNALNAPISSKLFNLGSADLGSLDITVKTEYLSGVSPTQFATQVAIVVRFSANSGSDKQIFQDVVLKIDTSGELFIDLELVSISGGQSFIQTADSEHWYSTNYVTEI